MVFLLRRSLEEHLGNLDLEDKLQDFNRLDIHQVMVSIHHLGNHQAAILDSLLVIDRDNRLAIVLGNRRLVMGQDNLQVISLGSHQVTGRLGSHQVIGQDIHLVIDRENHLVVIQVVHLNILLAIQEESPILAEVVHQNIRHIVVIIRLVGILKEVISHIRLMDLDINFLVVVHLEEACRMVACLLVACQTEAYLKEACQMVAFQREPNFKVEFMMEAFPMVAS